MKSKVSKKHMAHAAKHFSDNLNELQLKILKISYHKGIADYPRKFTKEDADKIITTDLTKKEQFLWGLIAGGLFND